MHAHEQKGVWERERGSQANSGLSAEPDIRHQMLHLRTQITRPKPKPRVGGSADCTTQVPPELIVFKLKCHSYLFQ